MNWLTNFIRPRINSFVGQPKDVPDNLWIKCTACDGMLFHTDFKEQNNVCSHCGHHLNWPAFDRLAAYFDNGNYEEVTVAKVTEDPLRFKDKKPYATRLKEARIKTGRQDAIIVAKGTIGGQKAVIAIFDFAFMGGSMGAAVGEGLVAGFGDVSGGDLSH